MSRSLSSLLAMTILVTCDCRNLMHRAQSVSNSDLLYQAVAKDQEYGMTYTILMVAASALIAYGITSWVSKRVISASGCTTCEQPTQGSESSALVQRSTSSSSQPSSDPLWTPYIVMFISIPALVGSCCWPLLVASLLGLYDIATAKYREAAHSISFGLHIGIFAVLLPQLFWRSYDQRKHLGFWQQWVPFTLAALGAALIMVDLSRHMLLDQGLFENSLGMYAEGGGLTRVGKIGVTCTWLGVVALVIGTSWLTSFSSRMQKLFSHNTSD